VDITIVTRGGAEVLRNYLMPNERPPKEQSYIYPQGTTPILKETLRPLRELADVQELAVSTSAMDIS
jgi:20S proteasome subunit beta 2